MLAQPHPEPGPTDTTCLPPPSQQGFRKERNSLQAIKAAAQLSSHGIALSDVAVGKMILEKAEAQGVGTMLTLMEEADILR